MTLGAIPTEPLNESKKKTSLLQRLKKAASNPLAMAAVAGISYFAGLKQNNNSQDALDSIDALCDRLGEISHIQLVGDKGSYDCQISEYKIRDGEKAKIMRSTLKIGDYEEKVAYDYGTNDGIYKTDGLSMYAKSGEWIQGDLTKDQIDYLDGKNNDSMQIRLNPKESKTENSENTAVMNKMKREGR